MTVRQYVLKVAYPIIMFIGKIFPSKNDFLQNYKNLRPNISFYDLKAVSIDGTEIDFSSFKGKKVMIVNTASDCGYTAQYNELEKLHQQQKDKLVIIGFPANDFKEQEKKDDTAIANFCKRNYGVNFLLAKKSRVIKGINQNNVFNWLSDSVKNGWCNQQPVWNFSKYLINENGMLTYFFSNKISPLDKKVLQSLN